MVGEPNSDGPLTLTNRRTQEVRGRCRLQETENAHHKKRTTTTPIKPAYSRG